MFKKIMQLIVVTFSIYGIIIAINTVYFEWPLGNYFLPMAINVDGDAELSLYEARILRKNFEKIPEDVKQHFFESGYEVKVVSYELEDIVPSKEWEVCGVYKDRSAEILLEDTKYGCAAIIHEFGHYVSHAFGKVENSANWIAVWEAEPISDYGNTSAEEGFAAAYSAYYKNEKKFSKTHPKSANCVQILSHKIKKLETKG